ncbi:spondin domain-containing protein [Halosegnis marinus]|uniref:Spondin domain-containing protein n=1 Tax=Halosegnis marinus TaxID=3034023 RepID=A0ABD5ZP94_9EURY|nr:spondin domain-containing protein [Halosegnis sp. DT85]
MARPRRPADGNGPTNTPRLTRRRALAAGGAALAGAALVGAGGAGARTGDDDTDERRYRVTVANLTPGQPFTPPAVAAHSADVEVFAVGDPANEPTRQVAENGNLGPLVDLIGATDEIRGAAVGDAPLVPRSDPGDTGYPSYASLELTADEEAPYLTFVGMLVATNDGIVGLDTVPLPGAVNASRTYYANGYDVGTERNTELYEDLVPPAKTLIVGGEPEGTTESDPDLAEDDVVRPHPGIVGDGDLDPDVYGWDEPAALVQVERLASE